MASKPEAWKGHEDSFSRYTSANGITESIDSISRDGLDTYIYIIHYKTPSISEQVNFEDF